MVHGFCSLANTAADAEADDEQNRANYHEPDEDSLPERFFDAELGRRVHVVHEAAFLTAGLVQAPIAVGDARCAVDWGLEEVPDIAG